MKYSQELDALLGKGIRIAAWVLLFLLVLLYLDCRSHKEVNHVDQSVFQETSDCRGFGGFVRGRRHQRQQFNQSRSESRGGGSRTSETGKHHDRWHVRWLWCYAV